MDTRARYSEADDAPPLTAKSRIPRRSRLPGFGLVVLLIGACTSNALQPDAGSHTVGTGQGGDGGDAITGNGGAGAGGGGIGGGGAGGGGTAGGGTAGGGTAGGGTAGGGTAGGGMGGTALGRVLVVQQGASATPSLSTRAWFASTRVCTGTGGYGGYGGCSCSESTTGDCVSRSCQGRDALSNYVRSPLLLGYGAGDPPVGYPYPPLNAGTLEIGNGSLSFTHPASGAIEVYDSLPSPWQSGDTVRISASGDTFPSFTTDVPFPPRVTFLQPSFGSGPLVVNPGTLDVRWTPVDGSGTVEVMVSSGFQPDAAWAFTVVRCSAPIGQGQMQVPIASRGLGTSSDWVTLVFRVLNRRMVQAAGLNLDAIVASFDSGPIDLGGGTGGTGGTSGAAGTTGRGGAGGGGKGGGGAGGGATGRGGTGG